MLLQRSEHKWPSFKSLQCWGSVGSLKDQIFQQSHNKVQVIAQLKCVRSNGKMLMKDRKSYLIYWLIFGLQSVWYNRSSVTDHIVACESLQYTNYLSHFPCCNSDHSARFGMNWVGERCGVNVSLSSQIRLN